MNSVGAVSVGAGGGALPALSTPPPALGRTTRVETEFGLIACVAAMLTIVLVV